jgi:hypothetical protein
MKNEDIHIELLHVINAYIAAVRNEMKIRWESWQIDMSEIEKHEVVGALLARQVTLGTQLASAPPIWNGHTAPILLRSMVDNYINLAWILREDSLNRSKQFIEYGLGQQKLIIEHRKEEMKKRGIKDAEDDPSIKALEDWINSQRYTFLTTVNIGQWAGMDTRKMAEEAGCLDLYRFAYAPFSSSVHNQWNHISRYNMIPCTNPLHRYHKIPIDPDLETDIDYFYRAAKYVEKAFKLFDEKMKIKIKAKSSLEQLEANLDKLGKEG